MQKKLVIIITEGEMPKSAIIQQNLQDRHGNGIIFTPNCHFGRFILSIPDDYNAEEIINSMKKIISQRSLNAVINVNDFIE
jgi:hypothetical protein